MTTKKTLKNYLHKTCSVDTLKYNLLSSNHLAFQLIAKSDFHYNTHATKSKVVCTLLNEGCSHIVACLSRDECYTTNNGIESNRIDGCLFH